MDKGRRWECAWTPAGALASGWAPKPTGKPEKPWCLPGVDVSGAFFLGMVSCLCPEPDLLLTAAVRLDQRGWNHLCKVCRKVALHSLAQLLPPGRVPRSWQPQAPGLEGPCSQFLFCFPKPLICEPGAHVTFVPGPANPVACPADRVQRLLPGKELELPSTGYVVLPVSLQMPLYPHALFPLVDVPSSFTCHRLLICRSHL